MQMTETTQLCLKIRREKTTYFFMCKQLDTIDSLKQRLVLFHKGIEPSDIRLYINTRLIDDKSNLHDQDLKNNSLVHYKLRKGNGGDWEEFPELGI